MLIGNGPYLVDRVDGGLHQIGVLSAKSGAWEADCRARIRGLPVRTAVDDLHDAIRGVAATHERMHAVRTLSPRLPVLSPAEAIEYVSALLDGDAPKRIVAVATKELVEPLNPVFAVENSPRCSPPERLPVGRQPKPGRLTVALLETGSLGVKSEAGQCGCASGCACC